MKRHPGNPSPRPPRVMPSSPAAAVTCPSVEAALSAPGRVLSKKGCRDKGLRRERQIVQMHREMGVKAERVPLSGASRYRGNGADVDVYVRGEDSAPLVTEIKARASGEGFATLERWLAENDAMFLMRDRAEPLVVMPWRTWAWMVSNKNKGEGQ